MNYALALANCAKMGIPIDQARTMTYWEYDALTSEWASDGDTVSAPDPIKTQALLDKINADPRLTT